MTLHDKLQRAADDLAEVAELMGRPGYAEVAAAKSLLDKVLATWGQNGYATRAMLQVAEGRVRAAAGKMGEGQQPKLKTCVICKEAHPLAEFARENPAGYSDRCSWCERPEAGQERAKADIADLKAMSLAKPGDPK